MVFSGDHVMQGSTVVIAPPDGDMAAYLGSLRRLRDIEPALRAIAPGHGSVIADPGTALDAIAATVSGARPRSSPPWRRRARPPSTTSCPSSTPTWTKSATPWPEARCGPTCESLPPRAGRSRRTPMTSLRRGPAAPTDDEHGPGRGRERTGLRRRGDCPEPEDRETVSAGSEVGGTVPAASRPSTIQSGVRLQGPGGGPGIRVRRSGPDWRSLGLAIEVSLAIEVGLVVAVVTHRCPHGERVPSLLVAESGGPSGGGRRPAELDRRLDRVDEPRRAAAHLDHRGDVVDDA